MVCTHRPAQNVTQMGTDRHSLLETGYRLGCGAKLGRCRLFSKRRKDSQSIVADNQTPVGGSPRGAAFCTVFSYLWGIFRGVNHRGRVIVGHARLWIQGSKRRKAECAANYVFSCSRSLLQKLFLGESFSSLRFCPPSHYQEDSDT